jgi:Cu(I)/Ag(I) efflux system protein CusF
MKAFAKFALAGALVGVTSFGVHAASHSAAGATSTEAASQMSEGEIRKIDKDAKKITIKHGELKNLNMPPMTMVFRVKDPTMLDTVQSGDKISFVAEKSGGQFIVTRIEVKQ